jgi:CheY-like chemotaxis protein/HPt (histidine-containing phosphotransfer) domain-containing protein
MTESSTASFQAQLAQLARQFADQLPGRLARMRQLLEALGAAGWQAEPGEELHRIAHSLAGAGGTLGMPEVGQAARRMEQTLKPVVQGQARFDDLRGEVAARLAELAAAIPADRTATDAQPVSPPAQALPADIRPMKVLVVDDDAIGRGLLDALLRADGHEVVTAVDGVDAVARFQECQPDLVFMDVLMPNMDGYEAARRIKAGCGKAFVPLIFLTALQDEDDLARCIASGGDDFIVKPYNRILLKAKLIAMQRIRELHQELARHQQRTAEEIELSKHLFDAVTNRNPRLEAVRHWRSSVGHFSGDLLLYERSPTGRLRLMFGDFTGHGLSAAIASVPVSDLFYALVADEASLPDLTLAINRKLKDLLPVGHFCAAMLVGIDPAKATLEVWNGGIPGVYLLDAWCDIRHRVASAHPPLGILGDRGFDPYPERFEFAPGDSLLCFSDGLNEVADARGEMLGLAGAEALFPGDAEELLERLRQGVDRHLGGLDAQDDISVLQLEPDRLGADESGRVAA